MLLEPLLLDRPLSQADLSEKMFSVTDREDLCLFFPLKRIFTLKRHQWKFFPHLIDFGVILSMGAMVGWCGDTLQCGWLLVLSPSLWGKAETAGVWSITRVLMLAILVAIEALLCPGHPSLLPHLSHGPCWRGQGGHIH